MPAKPPSYAAELLLSTLAYLETGAELDGPTFVYSGLREHGVPWSTAGIVGHEPSRAECRACLRTAAALEKRGMIEQVAAGTTNRTTHIRPTAAGLAEALRLAEGQADSAAIRQSLERTSWGAELADTLEPSSPSSSEKDLAP